jgi:pectin lyase
VEGNVFQNVVTSLLPPIGEQVFASPDTTTNQACSAYLGHMCRLSVYGSSGSFPGSSTAFFSNFNGETIASASSASVVAVSVVTNAGVGTI